MTQGTKTLALELAEEERRLTQRFIHATRPKRLLSLQEATDLSERMARIDAELARKE